MSFRVGLDVCVLRTIKQVDEVNVVHAMKLEAIPAVGNHETFVDCLGFELKFSS